MHRTVKHLERRLGERKLGMNTLRGGLGLSLQTQGRITWLSTGTHSFSLPVVPAVPIAMAVLTGYALRAVRPSLDSRRVLVSMNFWPSANRRLASSAVISNCLFAHSWHAVIASGIERAPITLLA